jgi:hypothetical protein
MVLLHYELQQLPANGLNAMKLLPDTDTEMCLLHEDDKTNIVA